MRYSNNNDDAIEIMNDGFVKIFRAISKFIEPEDETLSQKVFMSWLKIIMINTSINYSKAIARRISWTPVNGNINHISIKDRSAEENLAYDDLVKLIQQLTPAYRNTFSLYVIEGYKHEEISKILGISAGTSKSNLLKARTNLRKMIEKIHGEKFRKYG
jgi:RNA polymerase sigma-70 factor (ECF subfamily)